MRKDTLFIFSSDNGGPNPGQVTDNGPLRAGKATLYEGGTRVVAFATWDGKIAAGSTVKAALHMVDWYPTLLKLAGVSTDQKLPLDGRDAWPAITEGAASPHDAILLNTTPTGGAIRVGEWKLIVGGDMPDTEDGFSPTGKVKKKGKKKADKGPRVELFNLAEDPNEKNNLASTNTDKVGELRTKLDELAKQAVPPKSAPMPTGFKTPRVWGQKD